jgi:NADH-quinone oxidoreductase subunit N
MTPQYLALGILVLGAVVLLLLAGWVSTQPRTISLIGVPFALVAAIVGWQSVTPPALAIVAPSVVCGIALLLIAVLRPAVPVHVLESGALLLLGTAGAIALAGASDLVQAVVGLETLALSAVTLVALSAGDRALEAAFKYFTLGAVSLASLVYGLGLVYLGTGSLGFPSAAQLSSNPLTLAGAILVGLGFAFELALAPLHWGALDAYTAAAPSLAGFVMSASKLGAAYALGRLALAAGVEVDQILIWVGSLTIIWGTFGALSQGADLRRMLAYSAITHAGFIGLAAGSGPNGPVTAAFYAAMYASMAMLVFAALAGQDTTDLRGLDRPRALALSLGLVSLAGVPPMPGFWAKLAVLVVAWQAAGWLPTLIAALGGVFSVLYYLRPLPDLLAALRGGAAASRTASLPGVVIATLAVVALSVFPGVAWALAVGA